MTRKSFGLLVRLIAVVAAIYALLMFRSNLPGNKKSGGGPIPVKVVSEKEAQCSIIVRPVTITDHRSPRAPIKENPSIAEAIRANGKAVAVRDLDECQRLKELDDSVFTTEKGSIRIQFKE